MSTLDFCLVSLRHGCIKSHTNVKWRVANMWVLLSGGVSKGRVCYYQGFPVLLHNALLSFVRKLCWRRPQGFCQVDYWQLGARPLSYGVANLFAFVSLLSGGTAAQPSTYRSATVPLSGIWVSSGPSYKSPCSHLTEVISPL